MLFVCLLSCLLSTASVTCDARKEVNAIIIIYLQPTVYSVKLSLSNDGIQFEF